MTGGVAVGDALEPAPRAETAVTVADSRPGSTSGSGTGRLDRDRVPRLGADPVAVTPDAPTSQEAVGPDPVAAAPSGDGASAAPARDSGPVTTGQDGAAPVASPRAPGPDAPVNEAPLPTSGPLADTVDTVTGTVGGVVRDPVGTVTGTVENVTGTVGDVVKDPAGTVTGTVGDVVTDPVGTLTGTVGGLVGSGTAPSPSPSPTPTSAGGLVGTLVNPLLGG